MYHRGSHHSQPQIIRNKFIVNSPPQLRVNPKRDLQQIINDGLAPLVANIPKMVADALAPLNKRGSDDDRRQIIADLISDDNSPFTPEDEEALRFMSDASLKEMRGKYLKANARSSDTAIKAMSAHSLLGDDFHRDAQARRARADAYNKAHPIKRVTNSNDKAVQAMSGTDMVAHMQNKGK